MTSYTLSEIAKIADGQLQGNGSKIITHLVTDSRQLFSVDDSLFFAIKGKRHNGHDYIAELYSRKNLKQFVVEYIPKSVANLPSISFIVVTDAIDALQKIAAYHRNQFKYQVVGITGSNGKTIVKEWLFQLLQSNLSIIRSPKSYNSQIGVPLSVWNMDHKAHLAIFEAGISQINEMQKLQTIINPDIGIFTNIGEAHQENFDSRLQKAYEKAVLFKTAHKVIYCSDYPEIDTALRATVNTSSKLVSWGTSSTSAYTVDFNNKSKNLAIRTLTETYSFTLPFENKASVENATHCIVFLLEQGYTGNEIALKIKHLSPVAMRLELKKGIQACSVINDSYNSDLYSLSIALDFMITQKQHNYRTIILSDILQTGRKEDELYAEVNTLLNLKKVNRLIAIGPAISKNIQQFTIDKTFYDTTDDFLRHLPELSFNNQIVLIKGARHFQFERISAMLEEKRHRTVLEINLNAMVHNLNYFRSKLKPDTKIMAMVKALSYGSGTYEIANMLDYQKVDYLAVAIADEGVTLRKAGISMPIVVMNPEEESFNLMTEYRLEPEIYSFRQLYQFINALNTEQLESYPIHIKLDTGMHRLGFMHYEIDELCAFIKLNKRIKISSIFSHLVASDAAEHDAFTKTQIDRFTQMSNAIIAICPYPIIRHILNSSGIERFPEAQFEMVRLGIGLYGISAINANLVQHVSTLKTTISQIKEVPSTETVGYSRKGIPKGNIKIAVLPIGYADGYNRLLSNGIGKVYVNGCYAPIIGNICMDMCMINITHIEASEGDEVEIFGNSVTISEIADQLKTIPYEVLTNISERVKRVYFHE